MASPHLIPEEEPKTITECLSRLRDGDGRAGDQALALLYPLLQRMARGHIKRERSAHTLAATDLLNEAYLELVDHGERNWTNRAHFFGAAAQAVRRIVVDYAQTRLTRKRSQAVRVETDDDIASIMHRPEHYLAAEQALRRLHDADPELARIVEMRCFGGLTEEEIAENLGTSTRVVKGRWSAAKNWLAANLNLP